MTLRSLALVVGFGLLAWAQAARAAEAIAVPAPLRTCLQSIDTAIVEQAKEDASGDCIDYVAVRAAFERKWWAASGFPSAPGKAEIEKDPKLRRFAMIVRLSSNSLCRSARGIQRLLHGGAAGDAKMSTRPMTTAKAVSITATSATFEVRGLDAPPTLATFTQRGPSWKLTAVEFELKPPQ